MKYAVLCVEKQGNVDVLGYLIYDLKREAVRALTVMQTLENFLSNGDFDYQMIGDAYIAAHQKGTDGYTEYGPISVFSDRKNIEVINMTPVRIYFQISNFDEDDCFVSDFENALSRIEKAIQLGGYDIRNIDRLDMIWGIVHAEEELLSSKDYNAYQELRNAIESWSKTMVPFDGECMEIVKSYVSKMRSIKEA